MLVDEPMHFQLDPVYFKQIHYVILSLGARCLNRQRWDPPIAVVNESEQVELTRRAAGEVL